MGDRFPRGRTAVAGAATFGVGEAPGFSTIELAARAVQGALADAGIALPEVDGLFIALPDDLFAGLSLAQHLGIHPRFTDNNRTGGASFMSHLVTAVLMLDAGYLDCAVIAYGSNQRSSGGRLVTPARADRWDAPYAPLYPLSYYALAAARHMHQFGTTREQLAEVAVAARRWADTNPEAFAKGPLTVEDVLASRMISTPIAARDCCLVTDGAAALVLVRTDRARDCPRPPVPVLGAAAATWYNSLTQAGDVTVTAAAESGPRAMAMAGVTPGEIDVVQLYDAFTINTVLFLEDLGFCAKGEGGAFVSGGRIAPGGALPVNTNGGGLSCCHPGMYGLFAMVEAVRQLRGEAANQIAGAELALAHGNGGTLSAQATVIFGGAGTV
ncbi:thiolase [Novosphingobium piscinae]|uniref:Thiolase n=1 Tax=Novosphingobium piscinae TaxID=1507448 RepID=A0A7X1FZD9_9SPHN|nr:thiolase [Novosphingobium piscinae]MBC2669800.1 thiolase [Novosphingobium piscinae]